MGIIRRCRHTFSCQRGQALVILLFFMIITITITSAASIVLLTGITASGSFEQGNDALAVSESGIEDALLRSLRNPSYIGETLQIGLDKAVVSVAGGSSLTATSTATVGNFVRKISVQATKGKTASVSSWREVY